jgi:sec-independent protein translocase protein TatB
MFDLGMMELLVIGVVALIVVGPKDLPVMFRTVGQFIGRMRAMARDFQRAMNDAADETGMRGLDRDIRKMTSARKLGLGDVEEAARSMAGTGADAGPKARGPATTRLAEERAAAAARVREAAAERAAAKAGDAEPAEPEGPPPGEAKAS